MRCARALVTFSEDPGSYKYRDVPSDLAQITPARRLVDEASDVGAAAGRRSRAIAHRRRSARPAKERVSRGARRGARRVVCPKARRSRRCCVRAPWLRCGLCEQPIELLFAIDDRTPTHRCRRCHPGVNRFDGGALCWRQLERRGVLEHVPRPGIGIELGGLGQPHGAAGEQIGDLGLRQRLDGAPVPAGIGLMSLCRGIDRCHRDTSGREDRCKCRRFAAHSFRHGVARAGRRRRGRRARRRGARRAAADRRASRRRSPDRRAASTA